MKANNKCTKETPTSGRRCVTRNNNEKKKKNGKCAGIESTSPTTTTSNTYWTKCGGGLPFTH